MSNDITDKRYAAWWEPPLAFLMVVAMILVLFYQHKSELRDLQRRVGELEQRK